MTDHGFALLRSLLSAGKLSERLRANELSFLIPLLGVSVYYALLIVVMALFKREPLYCAVLFAVYINSLMHLSVTRLRWFMTFQRAVLLNPQVIEQTTRLSVGRAMGGFPLIYASILFVDVLLVALVFTSTQAWDLLLVAASMILLHVVAFVHDRIVLAPVRSATRKFLDGKGTDLLVFLSGVPGTEYQLDQWIGVLDRLSPEIGVTIFLREHHLVHHGLSLPVPAVHMARAGDLFDFVGSGRFRTIIYLNNSIFNHQPLVFRNLRHVHINHGDSDKAANALNTSRDYDYVFVAGQASVERYLAAGWDEGKIIKVGRPQVERLVEARSRVPDKGKQIVLYAPTFEGNKDLDCYSSLTRMGHRLARDIIESGEYRLFVKLHPYTGRFQQEYKKEAIRLEKYVREHADEGHHWASGATREELFDLFEKSSLVISDVSSVAIDYLALDRPILATNPDGIDIEDGMSLFPFWKGAHVLGLDDDPIAAIEEALELDPRAEQRRELAIYYLGEEVRDAESMAGEFRARLVEIMERNP
jgi:hypothetical protein